MGFEGEIDDLMGQRQVPLRRKRFTGRPALSLEPVRAFLLLPFCGKALSDEGDQSLCVNEKHPY